MEKQTYLRLNNFFFFFSFFAKEVGFDKLKIEK